MNLSYGHCIKYVEDKVTKRYWMILLCMALLCGCAAGMAEGAPPVHEDTHRTVEREHGQPHVEKTDSLKTHTWVTVFDLYCEDCGRVIEENVRTEETQEEHTWNVTRQEPTCTGKGAENSVCTVCGAEKTQVLPKLAHVYADASLLEGRDEGIVTGTGQNAGLVIGEVRTAPTCTEKGRGELLCLTCQTAIRGVTLPAKGHAWDDWTAVQAPDTESCVTDQTEQRRCKVCGETETRVTAPAPGHQWQEETVSREPTCTETGEKQKECQVCHAVEKASIPALGHSFAPAAALAKHEAGRVTGSGEYDGVILGEVAEPSTCTENGSGVLLCLRCQEAEKSAVIPMGGHAWSEWEQPEIPEDQVCVTDEVRLRRCLDCGLEETELLSPAPGHRWIGVSFTEPTCVEPGRAVRQCAVCRAEEVIETPAMGHCYMWMDAKQPNGVTVSQYVCTVCGDVAEQRVKTAEQIYYNNTITSFGPCTRDLIGGSVWNRVTPLNLAEEGVFTYPLIASNTYTVGAAVVLNEKGTQLISYKLNSKKFSVHTQTLVIYPDLESLRTGENALILEFDQPTQLGEYFGDDQLVIMAITLKADYDAKDPGLQSFREDEELIKAMKELID